MTMPQPKI